MNHRSTLSSIALYICLLAFIVCIVGVVSGAIINANPQSGSRPPDAEALVAFAGIMIGGLISIIGAVISMFALVKEEGKLRGFIALVLNGIVAIPMGMFLITSFAHNRAHQERIIAQENRQRIDVEEVAPGVECENISNNDGVFVVGKSGMTLEASDICLRDLLDRIEQLENRPSYRYEIEVEGPTNFRLTLSDENMVSIVTLNRIARSLPGWWEVESKRSRNDKTENGIIETKTILLKRIARP